MELDLSVALWPGRSKVAKAIAEAVRERGAPSRMISLADELARPLHAQGLPVVAVSATPRRSKKGPPAVAARAGALPFAEASLDAVVLSGADDAALLREAARVLRDGGLVALTSSAAQVRRSPPERIAAGMIHAALVDVGQQRVGSTLLTTARVRRWV